jgi:lysozyme
VSMTEGSGEKVSNRALGTDVSFWNSSVDFNKMVKAGAAFCYAKASQLYPDSRFREYWSEMKSAGILRGAYHYLDWRASELTQAKLFTDTMGGDWGELPPVLDLEMNPAPTSLTIAAEQNFGMNMAYHMNPTLSPEKELPEHLMLASLYSLTPSEIQGKVWNFLQAVENITKKVPMIYSGYYYWLQWMTPNIGWSRYPFWLAWYASEVYVKVPPPWSRWTIWQYSGNGPGPQYGSTGLSIDMNYFNGTVDELHTFSNVPVTPPIPTPIPTPTPPQPTPVHKLYYTTVRMNVRSSPEVPWPDSKGNIIGTLSAQTVFIVDNDTLPGWVHAVANPSIAVLRNGGYLSKLYAKPYGV